MAEKDSRIEELEQALVVANNTHRASQAAADEALLVLDGQLSRAKAEALTLREDLEHAQTSGLFEVNKRLNVLFKQPSSCGCC